MILPTLKIETELWNQGYKLVCGADEVGRGCFAGPVVVGAVIFSPDSIIPEGVADSKLLTARQRQRLSEEIKTAASYWSIAEVGVDVINTVGIGQATHQAFVKAFQGLPKELEHCLIDAVTIKGWDLQKQTAVVSGDKVCVSIAAASIIAKVYRDNLMNNYHQQYPLYGFEQNKGYGTKYHQEAIKKHGLIELHRTSFNLEKFLS